ncbi:hypothetical protein BsWGS_18872 [Bradybaena similaris]
MTSSVMAFLVPVLVSCWHVTLAISHPSIQMLTSSSPGLEKNRVSFLNKRDEEMSPSPDYISNLWSDIENAFRFLEEQPVARSARQRASPDNSDRIRKQEKLNKLPFTQHNFIRFGKRVAQSLAPPSTSSGFSEDAMSSGLKLHSILNRLKDGRYVSSDRDGSELPYPRGLSGDNEGEDFDRFDKRQLHKFVRIGKRYFEDTNPMQLRLIGHGAQDSEDGQDGFGKRVYSKFVRIG